VDPQDDPLIEDSVTKATKLGVKDANGDLKEPRQLRTISEKATVIQSQTTALQLPQICGKDFKEKNELSEHRLVEEGGPRSL
jgi:hypothetical protein